MNDCTCARNDSYYASSSAPGFDPGIQAVKVALASPWTPGSSPGVTTFVALGPNDVRERYSALSSESCVVS